MKWINLAERQPVDILWDQIIMRRLDNKHVQTDLEIGINVFLPESWKDFEWLDESEPLHETLPEFNSWADFYEHYMLSEDKATGGVIGFMEHTLPHGFKVGTKYKS